MFDFNDFWGDIKENWGKYGVIILMLIHAWKFFFEYVRPIFRKEPKESKELTIKIPKEGCTITIKPLE